MKKKINVADKILANWLLGYLTAKEGKDYAVDLVEQVKERYGEYSS